MKKLFTLLLFLSLYNIIAAQAIPDKIYMPNIHTAMLYQAGNYYGYPIINVGVAGATELDFDDFDMRIKNYSYTYQLCNSDWSPVDLSPFDYIKGFTQNNLTQYRVSSISKTRYIHYQAMLPESNCMPYKSGNYLVKVYLNGDTSQLAFTRRLLLVNNNIPIGVQISQPFNSDFFTTSQKVQFTIDVTRLNVLNPLQQIKVVVLQNYRWDNAVKDAQPQFMRGSSYEYNGEKDFIFPAGKEYRWLDLRSFNFRGDRIKTIDQNVVPFDVDLQPDGDRTQQRYLYYADRDGFYEISTIENVNPLWQGDYANVHFVYVPANNIPYPGKNLYVIGQFTNYAIDDSTQLIYNASQGIYEKTLLLKQGYYTYTYATRSIDNPDEPVQVTDTDGNYWETENSYTVLVYYRSFSDRADELVGTTTINSRSSRTNF